MYIFTKDMCDESLTKPNQHKHTHMSVHQKFEQSKKSAVKEMCSNRKKHANYGKIPFKNEIASVFIVI